MRNVTGHSFRPRHGYGEKHFLVTPVTIEDLAGNNIGKPFDVDLFEDPQRSPSTSTVRFRSTSDNRPLDIERLSAVRSPVVP